MARTVWYYTIFLLYSLEPVIGAPSLKPLDVVIDTDVGADDAMAILLMLSKDSPANVLALTGVTGNTGIVNVTRNALLILRVAERLDIPVYSGSDQGLAYKLGPNGYFGYDGLGDIFNNKPAFDERKKGHAALALARIVKERPGRVTILCIGPLTNLALALHIYPRLLEDVKDVVILGGSYQGGGSLKPGVEFNTYMDPEAAAFVLSKVPVGKPVTVVPSETTHQAVMSLDWRMRTLGKVDSCSMKFLNKAERISLKRGKTWSLADQVAASTLLDPTIVKASKESYILVETSGDIARGAFFRDDLRNTTNVKLITQVDKEKIREFLMKYLSSYPTHCNI